MEQKYAEAMKKSDWAVTLLLMMLPIVNLVLLFVWAFGSKTHPEKRNFCKAVLIILAAVIVIYLLFVVMIAGLVMG